MKLHAYLNYGGNCQEAFRFYERHLGGRITTMMARGDVPDPAAVSPGSKESIQFAAMEIGETTLMAADVPPESFQPMRSVYLSLTVSTIAEAERVYRLLAEGGQIY